MATRKFSDLRKAASKVPQQKQQAGPEIIRSDLPHKEGLPIPVGKMFSGKYTPLELEGLAKLGLDSRKKIPDNLPDLIDKVGATVRESVEDANALHLPVPEDTPPLEVPEPVDLDALSEEAQASIKQGLLMAENQIREHQRLQKARSEIGNQAILSAVESASSGKAATVSFKKPAAAKTNDGVESRARAFVANSAKTGPSSESPVELADKPEPPPDNCPHCGFNRYSSDPIEVTPDDLFNYKLAFRTQSPFRRRYVLLGGEVAVTFRDLSTKENALIIRQTMIDQKQMSTLTDSDSEPEYWRDPVLYRTMVALDRIEMAGADAIIMDPIFDLWDTLEKPASHDTKLISYFQEIMSGLIKTEQMQSIVCQSYRHFSLLLDKLSRRAGDPNFFAASK